jgi:DNA-binding MarR family transcriptional regulator
LSNDLRTIAKDLMEVFVQSQVGSNMRRNRAVFNQKPGEVMVLHFISMNLNEDSRGLMVSEISENLKVTSPTVTQHINSLEAQGLVERHVDPLDRRVVRIQMTDNGMKYIQRINEARLNMFIGLVKHLGEEESLHYIELMGKVSDYMLNQQEFYLRNFEK